MAARRTQPKTSSPADRNPDRNPDPQSSDPTDAAGSSTDSSGGSEFFGDDGRGPAFDPEHAPAPEDALTPAPAQELPALAWEVATVKTILETQGHAVHSLAGKGDDDWVYTRDELAAIAPPLTNILNRYPATAAAAATGDELALVIGLGAYVTRSYQTRRAAIAEAAGDLEPERGAPVFSTDPPPPAPTMGEQLDGGMA